MPFQSDAQRKYMYAAADRGEIPEDVVEDFSEKTPKGKDLPEKVKKEKAMSKTKKATETLKNVSSKLKALDYGSTSKEDEDKKDCEEKINKGMPASVASSLAKRDFSLHNHRAGIANAQPVVGSSKTTNPFEPLSVPVRSVFSYAPEVSQRGNEVYKSCMTCGCLHKSSSDCSRCASLEHINSFSKKHWNR